MRLANVNGRAVLLTADDQGVDVALASAGKFGPDLSQVYDDWAGFCSWAASVPSDAPDVSFERRELGSPSPAPRQIIAVGLNYRAHAAESGYEAPDQLPPTFTKFVSSLAGPDVEVALPPGGHTDWEVELVAVIGQTVKDVAAPVRIAAYNPVTYTALAGGQPVARRAVVDRNLCNACHKDLALHGGIRQNVEYCVKIGRAHV